MINVIPVAILHSFILQFKCSRFRDIYQDNKRLINACNKDLKNPDCSSYWMPSENAGRSGLYFESTKFGTGDDATVDNLF